MVPHPAIVKIRLILIVICLSIVAKSTVIANIVSGSNIPFGVIIVIVDRLAFEDFTQFQGSTGNLSRLTTGASIGLMNVRTLSTNDSKNGYASLSSGARVQVGKFAGHAFMADEKIYHVNASDFYKGIAGKQPSDPIVHVGIGELNQTPSIAEYVGAIGETFADRQIKTAVIGNSDTSGTMSRLGALLAMNRDGTVPLGDVGVATTLYDDNFPGGVRTDYDVIFTYVENLVDEANVIVVDLGDLARLEQNMHVTHPAHAADVRKQSLERIGAWIERLVTHPDLANHFITVLSPSPSIFMGREGISVTPVIEWSTIPKEDRATGNLLTSPTTRRKGIVTNTDFLPTLFSRFEIDFPSPGGRVWHAVTNERPLQNALVMYEKIKTVHLQRLPVIRPYFFGILTIYAISAGIFLTSMYFRRPYKDTDRHNHDRAEVFHRYFHRFLPTWRFALTAFLSFPLALLLLGPLPQMSLSMTIAAITCLMIFISIVSGYIRRVSGLAAMGSIAIATTGLIVLDVVIGAPMMQGSLLGYDPVSGSRYYGIGNEYMGVLIGSSLVGVGFLLDRLNVKRSALVSIPPLLLGTIAFVMIHPQLGINVGGAITASFAAGTAYLFGRGQPITWKSAAVLIVIVIAIVTGVALFDSYLFHDRSSHLGQTVHALSGGDHGSLWSLFGRKIAINMKLIRLTIWSRVVFLALGFLGSILFLPNHFQRQVTERHPVLFSMCKVSFIGAVIALAVNDSGVVAAATCLLWPSLALLAVGFDNRSPKTA